MDDRTRERLLREAARRAFAKAWDRSAPGRPAASLLSASTPLRRDRHRQRRYVASC